jgi:uncharacterized protein (TIGR02453 family)
MIELINAMNAELVKTAPQYVVEPQKAIFRIYRDTRFSNNKTPYKTNIAANFPRRGMEKGSGAGLYFSISHKEIEVAGGVYMPNPEDLRTIRAHIAEHHAELRKILKAKAVRNLLGELWDQKLTRMPKGFTPDHPGGDLIKYKMWVLYRVLDPALATGPKLVAEMISRFQAMLPMVEFLNEPLASRRQKEARTAPMFE